MSDYGIVKGYPRIRKRLGRLSAYIQLVRPFTLLAPLFAGIFGVLAPVREITFQHILTAIYVGVTLALAQGAGQCLNQYADAELDKIVKPYRPIPSGAIDREEALGVSLLLILIAVARAFTINTFFGLVTVVLVFFAVFYSLAPLSPRRVHPVLNLSWMAFSRGFLPMFAVFSVYGTIESAWKYSVLTFLWVMGLQSTKDVPDIEGDLKFGIKTIPNSYGLKGQIITTTICMFLYTACTLIFSLYPMLMLVPLFVIAIFSLKRRAILTENTMAWTIFYVGLALIYIVIFVSHPHIIKLLNL